MYADQLRDRITLQQFASTDDTGFGQTPASVPWPAVCSLKCRVTQLSSKTAVDVYGREANEDVYRVYVSDRIPRTDGETSLHRLLRKPSEAKFRFLWRGDRTITPVGMQKPAGGMHDHLADVFFIDCLETPEGVGYQDLA